MRFRCLEAVVSPCFEPLLGLFRKRQGTRGATTSSFEVVSKRRLDAVEHRALGREVQEVAQGRRHLVGHKCHLQGPIQVGSTQFRLENIEVEASKGRARRPERLPGWIDVSWLHFFRGPATRRLGTPQKRHLVSQALAFLNLLAFRNQRGSSALEWRGERGALCG